MLLPSPPLVSWSWLRLLVSDCLFAGNTCVLQVQCTSASTVLSGNHKCSLLRKFISRFWRRWVRCKNSFQTHKPSERTYSIHSTHTDPPTHTQHIQQQPLPSFTICTHIRGKSSPSHLHHHHIFTSSWCSGLHLRYKFNSAPFDSICVCRWWTNAAMLYGYSKRLDRQTREWEIDRTSEWTRE